MAKEDESQKTEQGKGCAFDFVCICSMTSPAGSNGASMSDYSGDR